MLSALKARSADDRAVVGVDEPVVAVEELDAQDAVGPEVAGADLAIELAEPLERVRIAQVGGAQLGLEADLGEHLRVGDGPLLRALLDLVLEHEPDGEAERGHDEPGP